MEIKKEYSWTIRLEPSRRGHIFCIEDDINESEIELRLSFLDLIKLQYKIGQYIGYHLEKHE